MIEITSAQVPPGLAALFPASGYVYRRCLAVLDGVQAGRIVTDDAATPRWAVVQETSEGTVYPNGLLDAESVVGLVAEMRREHGVDFGPPAGDPRFSWMPPEPDYEGTDVDFSEHDPPSIWSA